VQWVPGLISGNKVRR